MFGKGKTAIGDDCFSFGVFLYVFLFLLILILLFVLLHIFCLHG